MRVLITAVLAVTATLVACGPREGQASNTGQTTESRKARPAAAVSGVDSATPPEAEPETAGPRIHPMAVAAAKAHMDELVAKRRTLEDQVMGLRRMMERHSTRFGEAWSPDPDSAHPWDSLVVRSGGGPPVNPFSPPSVASRIAVISEPGADGEAVSPKIAGWVWNEHDRTLDAARDSAAIRASEREDRRRVIRNTYGPHLVSTLQTLRGQIVLYSLYETPVWGPGEVASDQWAPLIDAGYIFDAPDNPLSPREVAELIVEVTTRGADGMSVNPQVAGWVWNSADRMLFAAGYRED